MALESIYLSFMAHFAAVYRRPHRGLEMVAEAQRLAMESGDPQSMGASRLCRAMIERWLGRPGNAIPLLDPVVAMARNVASRQRLIIFLEIHSRSLAEIGRIENAMACLREGIDLSERFGIAQRLGALHNTLGYCYGEICLPIPALQSNKESRELAARQMSQSPMGRRAYAEIRAQATVNIMENLFDQGKVDEALGMLESFKEESKSEVYDLFRHQWESRMNYLEAQILLQRGDSSSAATVIEENLEKVREVHSRKREGGFLRLLGELQMRRGQFDSATGNLNEAILILKEVGNPRQLWQAHSSLASAFEEVGRIGEAREQWGAATDVIQNAANGLSDRELKEGFLKAERVRNILSKAEG